MNLLPGCVADWGPNRSFSGRNRPFSGKTYDRYGIPFALTRGESVTPVQSWPDEQVAISGNAMSAEGVRLIPHTQ